MKTLVVTGFSAFPGAPANPTQSLMARLRRHARRIALLGWRLETRVLPVIYDETAPRLRQIERDLRPDILLHFGLAARRRMFSVETRAQARLNGLKVDALRRLPSPRGLESPDVLRARAGAAKLVAAIARTGAPAASSIDAGGYVCNQTFYASLRLSRAARVAFVHVPPIRRLSGGAGAMEQTALAIIFELMRDFSRPMTS